MPGPDHSSIGVFGGTFDPVHAGHIAAAAAARDALGLDVVLFVVAHDPWKKWDRALTPAKDRLAMVTAALAGEDRMEVSDMEIRRGGASYTADTLEELARLYPAARLTLIVGTDVLEEMDTWERAARLRKLANVAVITRPGSPFPEEAARSWSAEVIAADTPDISSTGIRAQWAGGTGPTGLVPPGVEAIIAGKGLYRPPPTP